VIAAERRLDRLFAGGAADEAAIRAATAELGTLDGALRYTHLRYHLLMKRLLEPAQVAAYDRLRGYGGAAPSGEHRHGGH
jgi:Spy/CpxP family protein refolding chaperone